MKILLIVILLALIWTTQKEYFFNGPSNFSNTTYSKTIPIDFSKREQSPMGDFKVPKIGNVELSSKESNPVNGPLGPFYELNGLQLENPDIEQLKYLDRVHNVPDITGTIQSKGSPFKGPRLEDMSEPSKYAGKSPNGLRDEIRYSELYANDTKGTLYDQSNIVKQTMNRIYSEPQAKIPDYSMNMFPVKMMTNTLG